MTTHDDRLRQGGSLETTKDRDLVTVVEGHLTDTGAAVLEFERQWWRFAGAKETAIRARFDVSSTRYYQALNWLIDQPAAYVADPLLVKRLLRLRESRRVQRNNNRDES